MTDGEHVFERPAEGDKGDHGRGKESKSHPSILGRKYMAIAGIWVCIGYVKTVDSLVSWVLGSLSRIFSMDPCNELRFAVQVC